MPIESERPPLSRLEVEADVQRRASTKADGLFETGRSMITWNNTAGVNSRTKKLTPETVRAIRKEYAEGKRGKDHAAKHNTSPANFNLIGRRGSWDSLK